MYAVLPTEEELEGTGMTLADYELDDVEVWPDCMPAIRVFYMMSTQWRVGMCGPTGLEYSVVPMILKSAGIKKKDRERVFADVRIMERAALDEMRKKD